MKPVVRIKNNQIQHFSIAKLIFISDTNKLQSINSQELYEIQKRFKILVQQFLTHDKDYNSSFIKDESSLPYNSRTYIGKPRNDLILHFEYTYKKPMMFLIDLKNHHIHNYINIEQAKFILDNELFEDMKQDLMYPRILDRMYKGINEINTFISMYEGMLKDCVNDNEVSGLDCIEIEFED